MLPRALSIRKILYHNRRDSGWSLFFFAPKPGESALGKGCVLNDLPLSFLHGHFVEGTQGTKVLHSADNFLDDVIDLFGRGEPSQAEAEAAAGQVVADTE